MKNLKLYLVPALLIISNFIPAQDIRKIFHLAMEQEISRNIKNLHLEGMKDPFYIGLNIADLNKLFVYSALGSIVKFSETPSRVTINNQVLVGDYNTNNLNYISGYINNESLPLDDSISAIKQKLWLLFDKAYKQSTQLYESKQSALKSRTQTDDAAALPDFGKGEKVLIDKPEITLKFKSEKLIQYANEISLALKPYKFIFNSWVKIVGYKANIYYSNSEGSKATYPNSVLRLVVNIETQATNGELIQLYQAYHALNETDLPAKDQVIKDIRYMAETVNELKNAPVFDDIYYGPVLFEDQAASEVVRNTMFNAFNENLFAARKDISSGTVAYQSARDYISTDDRINKKVSAAGLNVKDKSSMSEFNGIPLIGSYPIDMDGIVPPKEITLIENGVLKNLLCGRIPTRNMKVSNGHLRVSLTLPYPMIAPGVIEVDFNNSVSKEDLKKKLIEMAKIEGLNYALIVREIKDMSSDLKRVYKVDIRTGNEQIIRSAGFKGLTFNDIRKIVAAGNQKRVMNTLSATGGQDFYADFLMGCPATFITPDAFLLRDMEINKLNQPIMNKLPIVKNPREL